MRLQNKVAIVTGSASGLGSTTAMRFAQEGARIVITDINEAAIHSTVHDLQRAGRTAMGFQADVTDRSHLKALMQIVVRKFGRIDILVNNAGVTRKRPFLEMSDSDWDFVLGVNLKGVFYCSQAVAPYMIDQRYGKILNISSVGGTGTKPGSGTFNYVAAKAGVIQLTKTLARELGPHGINVNCVAPGNFGKSMSSSVKTPEEAKKHLDARINAAVLHRVGTARDIANAILFLVSDEASFISGQVLCVDGGRTDRM